jgi:hypothetical protein
VLILKEELQVNEKKMNGVTSVRRFTTGADLRQWKCADERAVTNRRPAALRCAERRRNQRTMS